MHLTRRLAVYWAEHEIRVNTISPGPFPRPSIGDEIPDFVRGAESKVPMGGMGESEEMKGVVVFLASGSSSYMTGQNIVIDGGWTAW